MPPLPTFLMLSVPSVTSKSRTVPVPATISTFGDTPVVVEVTLIALSIRKVGDHWTVTCGST